VEKLPKGNNPGRVTTAAALELRVSGAGRADPTRSRAAIQVGVERHLSDLGVVYNMERVANPALMGSLVLDLTIEPDGRTSRVRLHSAKLLSQGLQKRVLALARTWSFPPAAGRVRVSYPLLFLPPETDAASILSWERGTARVRGEGIVNLFARMQDQSKREGLTSLLPQAARARVVISCQLGNLFSIS
jgi:hypothetical protein